jgi:hypothetical protein
MSRMTGGKDKTGTETQEHSLVLLTLTLVGCVDLDVVVDGILFAQGAIYIHDNSRQETNQ